MNQPTKVEPWWGDFFLEEGERRLLRIGSLRLWLERLPHEWRIGYVTAAPDGDPRLPPEPPANLHRYAFQRSASRVALTPRLADRPVISRPEKPLYIPSGEEITLYVGTPLWIAVTIGGAGEPLREFPIERPSDSWFGPATQEGGFSYAASTRALTTFDAFPFSPLLAVTPLLIRNSARTPLHVERLNLPVPFLSLFEGENGALWTESVTLERDKDHEELAVLRFGRGAPPEAGPTARRVSGPRGEAEKNRVIQAFNSLFD